MPRLFVALDLPAEIKEFMDPLIGNLPATRWVDPEHWHVTLRFIGNVGGGCFHDIMDVLAEVSGEPLTLCLKGLGCFPRRGQPRILWVGVEQGPQLKALKRRIDRVLRELGIVADQRKFAPHVTIARFREPPPPGRLISHLTRHALFHTDPFHVSDFSLYSSWLRPAGSIYHEEARYELVPGLVDHDRG